MTEHNNTRDERLARLAARSAGAPTQPSVAAPQATSATPMSPTAAVVPTARTRRRHPALAGRIAVTGIGVSTMLGMVGAFSLAEQAAANSSADAAPVATQPVQVVVVIHPATTLPGSVDPTATPVLPTDASATVVPAAVPTATAPPVVLTAKPQVQPAPAPAPKKVVKTSGSK